MAGGERTSTTHNSWRGVELRLAHVVHLLILTFDPTLGTSAKHLTCLLISQRYLSRFSDNGVTLPGNVVMRVCGNRNPCKQTVERANSVVMRVEREI